MKKLDYEAPKLEEQGRYTVITGGSQEIFVPDFDTFTLPDFEDSK